VASVQSVLYLARSRKANFLGMQDLNLALILDIAVFSIILGCVSLVVNVHLESGAFYSTLDFAEVDKILEC